MAHHHGRVAALDVDDGAQRARIAEPDLGAGEVRGHRISWTMVNDRNAPTQRECGARHRPRIGSGSANQHMRRRREELYECPRASAAGFPVHRARRAKFKRLRGGSDQHGRQRRRGIVRSKRDIRRFMYCNQRRRLSRPRRAAGRGECRRRGAAGTRRLEQHAHRAFAPRANAEQDIVGSAHVVFDGARHSALQDLLRMQHKVGFEAAAAEQPDEAAVGPYGHAGAGFAVGRAGRRDHGREYARSLRGLVCQEQFETRVEAHVEASDRHLTLLSCPTSRLCTAYRLVHAASNILRR
jgi:hypothetical protein